MGKSRLLYEFRKSLVDQEVTFLEGHCVSYGQNNPTHLWEKKITAVNAHQSQALSIYLDMIERQCLAHGKESGTKRAEGFLYLPMFGRPDDGDPLGD